MDCFWESQVSASTFLTAPKHTKKLERYSLVLIFLLFLTRLFVCVRASDELIGTGTDWLLLREGGNFSVIL